MGVLCWVGRGRKGGVRGQVTPLDDLEGRGLHDRLDEVVQGGPDAVGWDWTWETCRGRQRDSVTMI